MRFQLIFLFKEKHALVTGATRGISLAFAKSLLAAGFEVNSGIRSLGSAKQP